MEFLLILCRGVSSQNTLAHFSLQENGCLFDCPIDYLKLVLTLLTSAFVNKVQEGPHWRPPVWKRSARQISWKRFELDEVKALFQSSSTPLALSKTKGKKWLILDQL